MCVIVYANDFVPTRINAFVFLSNTFALDNIIQSGIKLCESLISQSHNVKDTNYLERELAMIVEFDIHTSNWNISGYLWGI